MAKSDTLVISATGRRKTAVARIRLTPGEGTWKVNKQDLAAYFHSEALCNYIQQPLKMTNMGGKFNVSVNVSGGGIAGQAGALRHALSRALTVSDASLRAVLKSAGCLTRDSRMKERKKSGQPGARKRYQFSKR